MYNPKSLKAEEFISHEEILDTLKYADENKDNLELVDSLLEKAKELKGLTHREASVLLACEDEERIQKMYDLAELFKVFGDSTRIRILFVLFEAEVCVCDLAKVLNMTQSAISHQLRILKQNKLVNSRREGKSVFYSLADGHVRTIIAQGREHIEE